MREVRAKIIEVNSGMDVFENFKVQSSVTAEDEIQAILERFNRTLKQGEEPRKLIAITDVIVMDEAEYRRHMSETVVTTIDLNSGIHDWNKVNLVTLPDGGDKYRCKKCGLEGMRKGLGGWVSVKGERKIVFNCI